MKNIQPDKWYMSISDFLSVLKFKINSSGKTKTNKDALKGQLKDKLDTLSQSEYSVPSEGTVGRWLGGKSPFRGVFYLTIKEFCEARDVKFNAICLHDTTLNKTHVDSVAPEFVPYLINMNASLIPSNNSNRISASDVSLSKLEVSFFPNTMKYEFTDPNGSTYYEAQVSLDGCWIYAALPHSVIVKSIEQEVPIFECGLANTETPTVNDLSSHIWSVKFESDRSRSDYQFCSIASLHGIIGLSSHLELVITHHDIRLTTISSTEKELGQVSRGENNSKRQQAKKRIREHILKTALKRKISPKTTGVLLSASLLKDDQND